MNSNKELLDWAVENIKEWDDRFTHLYSDDSGYFYGVIGFTKEYFNDEAYMWEVGDFYNMWTWVLRTYEDENNHPPVQVITKQEWLDAKKEKEI